MIDLITNPEKLAQERNQARQYREKLHGSLPPESYGGGQAYQGGQQNNQNYGSSRFEGFGSTAAESAKGGLAAAATGLSSITSVLGSAVTGATGYFKGEQKQAQERFSPYTGNSISSDNYQGPSSYQSSAY